MREWIERIYESAVDVIVNGLILTMLVTLGFAFFDVLMSLIDLVPILPQAKLEDAEFRSLVTSVLDIFVIIELFSTFIGYVRARRVRLSMLIDVTAVFILRDLIIKLYAHKSTAQDLLVLGALLVIVVIARTMTTVFTTRMKSPLEP